VILDSTLRAIEALPLAQSISESPWLFPIIETVHVFAITVVVGSIGMLDLRLLGVRSRDRPVGELAAEVLPWTWVAFFLALCSGALLFTSHATKYAHNGPFQLKMLLLVLAGVNMASFHLITFRGADKWAVPEMTPKHARVAGGASLLLWTLIVFCGRWIGFTT